jgi:hypothetical protein
MGCGSSTSDDNRGDSRDVHHRTAGGPDSDDDECVVATFDAGDVNDFEKQHTERHRAEEARRTEAQRREAAERSEREARRRDEAEAQKRDWDAFDVEQRAENEQISAEARRREAKDSDADVLSL